MLMKKMAAPLIIGAIVALYFMMWICTIFWMDASGIVILMVGMPLVMLLLLWVYVVKERIDEIRSGEEDDLSKY